LSATAPDRSGRGARAIAREGVGATEPRPAGSRGCSRFHPVRAPTNLRYGIKLQTPATGCGPRDRRTTAPTSARMPPPRAADSHRPAANARTRCPGAVTRGLDRPLAANRRRARQRPFLSPVASLAPIPPRGFVATVGKSANSSICCCAPRGIALPPQAWRMSGTQSTMFAVPSHAIIGKPQHFDGASRRCGHGGDAQALRALRLKSRGNFQSHRGSQSHPVRRAIDLNRFSVPTTAHAGADELWLCVNVR
jgi:hypothetical protein